MNPLAFIEPYITSTYHHLIEQGVSDAIIVSPEEFDKWNILLAEGKEPPASWNFFWEKIKSANIGVPNLETISWFLETVERHVWITPLLRHFNEHISVDFVQQLNSVSVRDIMTLHFIMDDYARDKFLPTAFLLKNKNISFNTIKTYIPPTAPCWQHPPILRNLLNIGLRGSVDKDFQSYFSEVYKTLSNDRIQDIMEMITSLSEDVFYNSYGNFDVSLLSVYYYARIPEWKTTPKTLTHEHKVSMNHPLKAAYLLGTTIYYENNPGERPTFKELETIISLRYLLPQEKKSNNYDAIKEMTDKFLLTLSIDIASIYEQLNTIMDTVTLDAILKLVFDMYTGNDMSPEINIGAYMNE